MSGDDRLGVLLVSCVRHQGYYAPALAAHPRLRVVAVTDEAEVPESWHAVNREFAAEYGVPYIPDLPVALARPDVQIVSVCSEPTRHARLATQAAQAGKHVWVDKPMAVTLAEADELVRAVEEAGVRLTYVHFLHAPVIQQARALIAAELGRPWAIQADFVIGRGLRSGTVEDFELVVNPRLSGGGEATNMLGYTVDYARYLSGVEVESVYARMAAHFFEPHKHYQVEDIALAALNLQEGVTATTLVGRSPAAGRPELGDFGLKLYTPGGVLMLDPSQPRLAVFGTGGTPAAGYPFRTEPGDDAIAPLVDEFVNCILEGRSPLRGVRDGRRLVEVLQAVYRSAASGQVVTLPLNEEA